MNFVFGFKKIMKTKNNVKSNISCWNYGDLKSRRRIFNKMKTEIHVAYLHRKIYIFIRLCSVFLYMRNRSGNLYAVHVFHVRGIRFINASFCSYF